MIQNITTVKALAPQDLESQTDAFHSKWLTWTGVISLGYKWLWTLSLAFESKITALKTGISFGCWWKEQFYTFVNADFSFLALPLGQHQRHELDASQFTSESQSCWASKAPTDFSWQSGCWKLWKGSWYPESLFAPEQFPLSIQVRQR